MTDTMPDLAGLTREYSAHNYAPLPVVVSTADGVWVTDVAGRRYLDMLAGYGFRSDLAAAEELADVFGMPVVSLRLVDPRFYHLDTALCVLDADTAMYYPAAFDDDARAAIAGQFAELIEAKDEDAEVLGLNAVSDGLHVVLPVQARKLAAQLRERGFEPIGVDLSELLKGGGGPKCCTLVLRS